jgi:hypothetical protein
MKTRSQTITFSVKEVEAAKALMQLKKACAAKPVAKPAAKNTWPSGRPRRSTAGYVNYAETD